MKYWVYENFVHDFAKVHKESCSYCNYGKGIFGGGKRPTGQWHGPLSSRDKAVRVGRETGRAQVSDCRFCTLL